MHWRRGIRVAAVLVVCLVESRSALSREKRSDERSWNKIRYQGGTIDARVNPFDWNTTLRISSAGIDLIFAGRKAARIEARDVLALTGGEKAYRHVADLATLSPLARPVALFGILNKSKDKLAGIEFKTPGGARGAVLLLVNKGSYRELLEALSAATGRPVQER